MKFTCSSGQRPLDGYTLKRGVGCGGFGEVYYAISDGGKEVALKLVRGNADIELRGIAQCLNLKHPHLVSLYDLKTDAQGDHWVVMEYVAGEPLNVVLNRHPNGLPPELAQQWFLAMSKAVGYLHDHGIVHRDLKPGNIFLENGILKIGDYGLSKFISSSQRTAQTQSVGTVYYMAPEISTGNYNKQIDIYAAGIMLYEMLTGRVPFEGESAGEILMKHLTSPPDLSKLPAAYIPIVGKALAKNPAQRYATMAEMAKAVELLGGAAPVDVPAPRPVAPPRVAPAAAKAEVQDAIPSVLPAVSFRAQVAELSGSMALAGVLALLLGLLYLALSNSFNWQVSSLTEIGSLFFLTVGISWAVLIPAKLWDGRAGDTWTRRVVMMVLGAAVGAGALWSTGWEAGAIGGPTPEQLPFVKKAGASPRNDLSVAAGYLSYFALSLCMLRWWKMADRHRSQRFSCFPVLAAGFWALLLLCVWPRGETPYGAIALVTAAVIVQWVSPWEQPPPPLARRLRLRYA
ncbi:MAG: serine/threonine protein kinase [Gemmataceae bacterium]|nr:serine/threonine protein kinase [Gemmataceae bacterium]